MKILFEDKNIIVCEKNVGLLSEEKENMITAVSILKEHKEKNREDSYIGVIHRLDVNTGGVILYAKNKKSSSLYSKICTDKEKFEKTYLAVIHGKPENEKDILKDLIFKDSKKNKSYLVNRMRKGVKDASLEYEVQSTVKCGEDFYSLVRIKLHTGRTHQIRVQFAGRKMPLVGDGKYGSKDNRCDVSLWAHKLKVENPFDGKIMEFLSEPDFLEYPWNMFKKERQ